MCGIVGGISKKRHSDWLEGALDALGRRGPDDRGKWQEHDSGIAIAQTRLSIQDLSYAGHQPMHSYCGRFVMVFNGELYNHWALREAISEPINWRGTCDAETLINSVATRGIEATLQDSVGMFAFALWDRKLRCLYLARDRMGEKPLYYGEVGGEFVFASDLAALKFHPGFSATIDNDAVGQFVRYNFVPASRSIYKGLNKLQAGHWIRVDQQGNVEEAVDYWQLTRKVQPDASMSRAQAREEFARYLTNAVDHQLISDVPVGAFLSGGYDSTSIVATMAAVQSEVTTFTIGFESKIYDEAPRARKIASALGTQHHELYVSEDDCLDVVQSLADVHSEPFADSSQIPMLLVSRLASQHVKVVLSGDGGDELFGGYNRHSLIARYWRSLRKIPAPLRGLAGATLAQIPGAWTTIGNLFSLDVSNSGEKLRKFSAVLSAGSESEIYHGLLSLWDLPPVLSNQHSETDLHDVFDNFDGLTSFCLADQKFYLPDDILVKVDRCAMYHSLEARVPYLDKDMVEFSWRLPDALKINEGRAKWLTRDYVEARVPATLMQGPKKGFAVPLESWLRGPLKEWAGDLLATGYLKKSGLFDIDRVHAAWQAHLSGERDNQHQLWSILMFQQWYQAQ